MKRSIAGVAGVLALCLVSVLLAGCLGSGIDDQMGNTTPEGDDGAGATYTFNGTNAGEAHFVGLNSSIILQLPENPTTGYQWQINTTPGLVITKDEYIPNATSGPIVGAGGVHVWNMTANTEGIKTISGSYKRPWEATSGNETTFTMHLWVVSGEAVPYGLVTLKDSDSTIRVEPNQTFRILLPENPSTGYYWQMSIPAGLLLQEQGFVQEELSEPMLGAGGFHYWDITAIGSGAQQITGAYLRPWESAITENTTTFRLTVQIGENNASSELYLFDATDNNRIVTVRPNSTLKLMLEENPTTGYSWILNTTPGIEITHDIYTPDTPPSAQPLVGAGGIHTWIMQVTGTEEQKITGIYKRPWEPTTGNETTYELILRVGDESGSSTSPGGMPAFYSVFTLEDDGKSIEVPLGDEFNIRLSENPSTGYSWNLSVTSGLEIVADEYIPPATSAPMLGAGGVRSWQIKVTEKGEQKITAIYKRPWEPTTGEEETFGMQILGN